MWELGPSGISTGEPRTSWDTSGSTVLPLTGCLAGVFACFGNQGRWSVLSGLWTEPRTLQRSLVIRCEIALTPQSWSTATIRARETKTVYARSRLST